MLIYLGLVIGWAKINIIVHLYFNRKTARRKKAAEIIRRPFSFK